jgi:magnesium-transporting ATPase (P-type)
MDLSHTNVSGTGTAMKNSQDNTPSDDTGLVEQLVSYPITAFTLVVAFAWNSAFQSWFAHHPKFKHHGPWVYAISVTVLCMIFVMALYYIQKKASSATSAIQNGAQQKQTKQTKQQKQTTQQKQYKQDSFMLM